MVTLFCSNKKYLGSEESSFQKKTNLKLLNVEPYQQTMMMRSHSRGLRSVTRKFGKLWNKSPQYVHILTSLHFNNK